MQSRAYKPRNLDHDKQPLNHLIIFEYFTSVVTIFHQPLPMFVHFPEWISHGGINICIYLLIIRGRERAKKDPNV